MTDRPLYLPAPLIPAFMAGRVSLLVEPLEAQLPDDACLVKAHGPDYRAHQYRNKISYFMPEAGDLWPCGGDAAIPLPHAPGDRLWLRETWAETTVWPIVETIDNPMTVYRQEDNRTDYGGPWRSPITMPKRASRAWAEVEAVDVKRVQDVTEGDCEAAGFSGFMSLDGSDCESPREQLQDHFHYTYGPDAWGRNPWCVFTRVKVHMGSLEGKG